LFTNTYFTGIINVYYTSKICVCKQIDVLLLHGVKKNVEYVYFWDLSYSIR
jgi:hypothetical protein